MRILLMGLREKRERCFPLNTVQRLFFIRRGTRSKELKELNIWRQHKIAVSAPVYIYT